VPHAPTSLSFSVADLAARVKGELHGRDQIPIGGLDTVQDAEPGELTFIGDEHHAKLWPASRASAAIVSRKVAAALVPTAGAERAIIVVPDADTAMIAVLELFAPPEELLKPGIHPQAVVESGASVDPSARVGPFVWIASGATVGRGVTLFPGVSIYRDAAVGDGSVLHANVVIRERCVIGRGVILHGGVQIGTDGFGYRPAPDGRGLLKVPHLGNVVIEDGVEIGANACVDRGKFGSTLVGAGSKIDNLVQVGHNCRIGRCCVISGLSGLAGSTTLGDGAQIGGGVGIADHRVIGRGARIAARSGVMNDVPDGETWAGYPAKEARRAMQEEIVTRKLPELIRNLKDVLGPEAARAIERGVAKPKPVPSSAGEGGA
jgi:UDP-3-O-[3-hydroxymyristoyl] glucosamine N-acyltransferase